MIPGLLAEPHLLKSLDEIDWKIWAPTERAVLCFVRDSDRLLLIHKKCGLGAGKINAPGGRIEPGESPLDAARRETIEETHVIPDDICETGLLHFQFRDGYGLYGTIFTAWSHQGTPVETSEADPFWISVDAVPFDDMWEDDRHWLPLMLGGKYTKGYFIFDGDRMIDGKVESSPCYI